MNHTPYAVVKFLTELILLVALYARHYERRPGFWAKLPLCLAGCYGFSVLTSGLILRYHLWPRPLSIWAQSCRYAAIFTLVALSVCFLMDISLKASFYICTGAYAIQHMSNKVYILMESLYFGHLPLVFTVIIYIFYMALCCLAAYFLVIRQIRQQDAVRLRSEETFFLNLLTIVSLIVLNCFSDDLEPISIFGRCALAGYGIICGVFLLSLQFSIFQRGTVERENEKIEYLLEQEQKRFASYRDSVDYLNIKCHDLKHQIHRLKQQEAVSSETILELEDGISQYERYSNTGFPALDIILGEKYLACKTNGIEFTASVEGEHLSRLSEPDIYALFGNALDNAIEYEMKLPKGERLIRLGVKDVGNMLFIRVENTYQGPRLSEHELKTGKGDSRYHGFGVKSMRHITEKYGGDMDVDTSDGRFAVTCMFTF